MLQRVLSSLVSPFGYSLVPRGKTSTAEMEQAIGKANESLVSLHTYKKPDGTFDYARYREIQEAGNIRKIKKVWVIEENIVFLSQYIEVTLGKPRFGLCHGTRRGLEQQWFRKYLGCDVLGTEISKTAADFPDTIQWDFHEVKPEWVDTVDFIYSNAFDHSYDPEKCLNAWMSCLRPGGICLLEHSNTHQKSGGKGLDPFGADILVMPYLITTWAKGKYAVRQLMPAPARKKSIEWMWYIVIQKL